MAEPYQPINVNTGSAQTAIASTPIVTPNLNNLMQGIASGFIAVDDIRKRASNGPLEAATRTQELADVQQIRPLQREAAVAQIENVKAQEQFEAESLPILNDTKREILKQEYNNVLQHGVPAATLKLFNQLVPGFMPYDKAKLFPKEGGVDISYATEVMGKALEKAEKLKLNKQFSGPVKQSTTGPKGEVKETTTIMNQLTGEPLGVPITTDTKAPDEVKAAQAAAQASEGIRKEFHSNATIQAFDKVDAAVNKIRAGASNPNTTPFQDMSSIFAFMKVLDPGSTVREGEYATVQKSAGVPDRIRNLYNAVWAGQKLTPEQRKQLLESAEQNYQGQLQNALPAIRQFSDLEEKGGFSPGTVVPIEFREKLTTTTTTPAGTATTTTTAAGMIPTVQTPAEASGLPAHIQFFKTPTGQTKVNPNYRP